MLVRYFMTSPVHTVTREDSCSDALADFRERRIRRAPVMDGDKLVGLISEGDLRSALPTTIGELSRLEAKAEDVPLVGEVMTPDPFVVHLNDSLAHAAEIMIREKIGGLPVVKKDRLVGVITESDVFRAVLEIFQTVGGVRVLVREPGGMGRFDYGEACARHGLRLVNLLEHEAGEGLHQTFFTVMGDPAPLLKEIRDRGAAILSLTDVAAEADEVSDPVGVTSAG